MELYHYGIKRRSGRYPWGSGDRPHQHDSGKASVKESKAKVLQYQRGEISARSALRKCGSVFFSDNDNKWRSMTAEMIDGKVQMIPPAETISWYQKNYEDNDSLRFANGGLSIKDLERTNPYFKEKDGYASNCTKCAATMEMRARGYDVSAGRLFDGADSNCFSYWFDGAKREMTSTEDVNSILHDFGPGARGVIDFRNQGGGGHEIFWCVDDDGSLSYLDGQNGGGLTEKTASNKDFNLTNILMEQYGFDSSKPAGVVRLDNTTPNLEAMAEDSVFTDHFRSHGRNYERILEDIEDLRITDSGKIITREEVDSARYDDYDTWLDLEDEWDNATDVDSLYSSKYYYNIKEDRLTSDIRNEASHKGLDFINELLGYNTKRKG